MLAVGLAGELLRLAVAKLPESILARALVGLAVPVGWTIHFLVLPVIGLPESWASQFEPSDWLLWLVAMVARMSCRPSMSGVMNRLSKSTTSSKCRFWLGSIIPSLISAMISKNCLTPSTPVTGWVCEVTGKVGGKPDRVVQSTVNRPAKVEIPLPIARVKLVTKSPPSV